MQYFWDFTHYLTFFGNFLIFFLILHMNKTQYGNHKPNCSTVHTQPGRNNSLHTVTQTKALLYNSLGKQSPKGAFYTLNTFSTNGQGLAAFLEGNPREEYDLP